MDTNLKDILVELQEQNTDLLDMFYRLLIESNQVQQKLNRDFYKLYNEIYHKKSPQDAREFLISQEFHVTSRNDRIDRINQEITAKFQKRHDIMQSTLEKIKNLL